MAAILIEEYQITVAVPDRPNEHFFAVIRDGKVDSLDGIGRVEYLTATRIEAYIQFLNEVLEHIKN